MSKSWLISDTHLGHKNITKYRTQFSTAEEHHNTVYENLATAVGKRDTLWMLGDIAFTKEWLKKIDDIHCTRKVLIVGNHDNERGINMRDLVEVYDEVFSLVSHRNLWLTHCPIHESEIRNRQGVIHGHTHQALVEDCRYLNVCVEHTEYKPIVWSDAYEKLMEQMRSGNVKI